MNAPISFAEFRNAQAKSARAKRPLYFQREELSAIMQSYSRKVMAGQCKDYSIDFAPGLAIFAMYKNAHEMPLFTVAKRVGPSGKGREFVLHEGKRPLKKSADIKDVLRILDLNSQASSPLA